MNARSYKTVFSKRLGALVAVGEHASSQGKANGAGSGGGAGASGTLGYIAALTASFALVSLAWAAPATNALPTAGQVVQGAASMSQTASQMTINQGTQRAAINWQSFNIGAQAKVQVVQPNAQAVLLNRVVGQSPSQIFGQLNANGHVILVNPNGVLFGKDGSVNAASFTASTLGISDANFMAGNMVYERNGSTAGIVNEGTITTAPGGYVALLGASVSNQGQINTQGGNAFLGAADTIKVPVSSTGRIKLELTAADMNANVSNTGSIITQGGQVYMQALALNQAAAQIIQSGSIDTTGEKGGAVNILADGGKIRVSGSIKANSTDGSAGGDVYIGRDKDTNVLAAVGDVRDATLESQGGFIETSGQFLATDGVSVKAKDWLLDPSNITISTGNDADYTNISGTYTPNSGASTSVVKVGTIESAISGGTSVTITTTNTGTQGSGVGNITVANALNLVNNSATNATLKLIADNGIFVNANIAGSSGAGQSGLVNINMVAKGVPRGNASSFVATDSSGIVVNNNIAIKTNGTVNLDGTNNNTNSNSRGITFNTGSSISAASFDIQGTANGLASGSHGMHMVGNNSFTSSSTSVTSQINGIAKSNGLVPSANGITAATNINGTVNFNAGNGSMVVKGSNSNTQLGVRVSEAGGATAIITNGNVTLGALEPNSNFAMRAGSITANSGSLNILGSTVSNFGGESITANNGVSINIEGKTTAGSTSNAVSFTNMTIKAQPSTGGTAGNINITGTSSTGAAINLASNVTIEGRNVTLKGTAANGTLAVNGGGGVNGSGKITASGEVVIDGVSANIWGYSTVTNGPISAAGNITIKGTGTAKHGVWLGNNVAGSNITSTAGGITIEGNTTGAGGIGGSAIGVGITGNAVLTADKNVNITGKTHGNPAINSLGNITSNNGNVTIDGYSRDSRGVVYGNTITANKGDIKVIGGSGVDGNVTSTAAGAGNEHGVYFSGLAKAKNVTIEGASINNVATFVGATSGTNIDATEKATIKGTSAASTGVNLGNNNGFGFFQATIKSGQDTEVTGKGLTGVRVWGTSSINAGTTTSPGSIKIQGETINTTAAQTGTGIDFQRFPTAASLNASKDIYIEGTLNGLGKGAGIQTSISGTTGQSPSFSAGENFILRGNNRGGDTNLTAAINADSGMQVTAGKNIVVQAETKNATTPAMNFNSLNDGVRGNTSFVSSGGDVLIQANQGSIVFDNRQTSSTGKLTDIKGRNITFDNTGAGMATGAGDLVGSGGTKGGTVGSGSIDNTTGAIVAGSGKANSDGINFVHNRVINATGQLNIMGASKTARGVQIFTELTGGSVNIQGTTETGGGGVYNIRKIEATTGDVSIIGRSTAATGHTGVVIQGEVKAKTNINLEGFSANTNNMQGIIVADKVTAETGTIKVTGETKAANQRAVAITQLSSFGSLNTTNNDITVIGNTLLIAPGTAVNAGTGTVQIKTLDNANAIVIGGNDNMRSTPNEQVLGIDNTELNRITAGKLVIGHAANTGGITVSAATTTLAHTGDVTLQTGGNIAINAPLTIGTTADRKNLDLKAGGGQITQAVNATITANQLTIQAVQANVALAAAANQVNQLVANVKSLDFKNGQALKIGVDTTGITASGKIKVETTTGDLTITRSVATTNADADAVVLNAGADKTFNNLTGLFEGLADGNIVAGGGAVTVGEGGVAQLYTGSTSANTASLAGGDGTGRYRYNSDEATTNFSKALEAGVNVIYREAPAVTVKVSDVNKVYDGVAHSGGAFSSASTADGVKNGDADALVGSNAVFSGNAQGVKDVLASEGKTISASDNGKNALGYKVTYKEGNLSITPRPLTIAPGSVATKTADGNTTAVVTPGALSNLVGTETLGVAATGTFSDANPGNNKAVNAFYTLQNGANGGVVSNYVLNLGTPANPDTRMTGNILPASVNPVVNPTPSPVNNNGVSRVRTVSGFGGAGAATGVLDDQPANESREVCSDLYPENCECLPSVIPTIEICFAPKRVVANKEEI